MYSQQNRWSNKPARIFMAGAFVILAFTSVQGWTQQANPGAEIRALPAEAGPPAEIAALERDIEQKIPRPPGRTSVEELVNKIAKRPGQAKKVDAARRGVKPGNAKPGKGKATSSVLESVGSFFIDDAVAADPYSLNLSPGIETRIGTHPGLLAADRSGYVWFMGGFIYWSYPNKDSVRLYSYRNSAAGHETKNPMAYLSVTVPGPGWYTINMNANAYGSANLLFKTSSGVLLDDFTRQSGWTDYGTLHYLEAGRHGFFFVLPGGGYISRLSVDCYKCL